MNGLNKTRARIEELAAIIRARMVQPFTAERIALIEDPVLRQAVIRANILFQQR
jgi:hypothetical protein